MPKYSNLKRSARKMFKNKNNTISVLFKKLNKQSFARLNCNIYGVPLL